MKARKLIRLGICPECHSGDVILDIKTHKRGKVLVTLKCNECNFQGSDTYRKFLGFTIDWL